MRMMTLGCYVSREQSENRNFDVFVCNNIELLLQRIVVLFMTTAIIVCQSSSAWHHHHHLPRREGRNHQHQRSCFRCHHHDQCHPYYHYRSCEHLSFSKSKDYSYRTSSSNTSSRNERRQLQQGDHCVGNNNSILNKNTSNYSDLKNVSNKCDSDEKSVSVILSKYGLKLPMYSNKRRGERRMKFISQRRTQQQQTLVLPGATSERRILGKYAMMNVLQILLFRCIATITKNRFRLQVNIVRWIVASSLLLLFKFYSQLMSQTTHNTWSSAHSDSTAAAVNEHNEDKIDPYGLLKDTYPIIAVERKKEPQDNGHITSATKARAETQQHQKLQQHQSEGGCRETYVGRAFLRNVPGGGSCLFNAIAACLVKPSSFSATSNENVTSANIAAVEKYVSQSEYWSAIQKEAKQLRNRAVNRLDGSGKILSRGMYSRTSWDNVTTLVLEGTDVIPTVDFTSAVAAKYGMTSSQYCQSMRRASCWGGAPEIIALSNALHRPICLYNLERSGSDRDGNFSSSPTAKLPDYSVVINKTVHNNFFTYSTRSEKQSQGAGSLFFLECKACYGAPAFGPPDTEDALHLLCADGRFPYLDEVDKRHGSLLGSGNHFYAVYPLRNSETATPADG